MKNAIDMKKVTPLSYMKNEDKQEYALLSEMAEDAYKYIISFTWCLEVLEQYFGIGVGGVFAVFLFRIKPRAEDIDEWLWVIVGDLPPAYLVTDYAPNPPCALSGYIERMQEWVEAVQNGDSVKSLILVNVEPSIDNARKLQQRLEFLNAKILNVYYLEDLKQSEVSP